VKERKRRASRNSKCSDVNAALRNGTAITVWERRKESMVLSRAVCWAPLLRKPSTA